MNRYIGRQNGLNQHIILGKSFQREAEIEQMLVHQIPINVKHAASARFARFRLQTDIRDTVFAPHEGAKFRQGIEPGLFIAITPDYQMQPMFFSHPVGIGKEIEQRILLPVDIEEVAIRLSHLGKPAATHGFQPIEAGIVQYRIRISFCLRIFRH